MSRFKMEGIKKISLRASSVDAQLGELLDISLIQVGDALGHGMRVDKISLQTALDALGETLPAYITHEGAFQDRILGEVGFFTDFHIEENKLKAKRFTALKSFREDEPEKYRRLFDIAENIPTNFGISLVFSAKVFWVLKDGTEVSFDESSSAPEGSVADLPVIRFTEINSADFVDTPAANADGLFTQKPQIIQMEQISESTDEIQEEEVCEQAEATEEVAVEASADSEPEVLENATEEVAATDPALELCEALEGRLNELTEQVASLASTFVKFSSEKSEADKALASYVEGVEPQPQTEESQGESIVEKFKSAQGKEFFRLWRENKLALTSKL